MIFTIDHILEGNIILKKYKYNYKNLYLEKKHVRKITCSK